MINDVKSLQSVIYLNVKLGGINSRLRKIIAGTEPFRSNGEVGMNNDSSINDATNLRKWSVIRSVLFLT